VITKIPAFFWPSLPRKPRGKDLLAFEPGSCYGTLLLGNAQEYLRERVEGRRDG